MKKNFKFSNTGNVFLTAFALYYAVSVAYQLLFTLIYGSTNWPVAAEWCNYLLNPIVFISVAYFYSRKKKVDFVSATKLDGKINFKQVGIVALLSIFCIMGFLPISQLFLNLLALGGFNTQLAIIDTSANVGAYFLGLLLLAIFPAFSEEILMRGVVLNAASQKRNYSYAILIVAALFSLMHGNPIQTVHQFLLGMVLAYIVLVSKSIWPAIILHFLNNFLSLTLDYPLNWLLQNTALGNMPDFAWILIWIFAIIIGCTMVLYLLRKFTKVSRDLLNPTAEKIIDVYPDGKVAAKINDFKEALCSFGRLFKKGGFKRAYDNVNIVISEIVPFPEETQELTREDYFPSNIKLAFIVLGVIWLLSLITGFIG